MSDIAIYLLKINVILAICYGVYRLCSQGSTFFHLHRYLLVGMYVLAAVLPFMHWDLGLNQDTVQEMTSTYVTHLKPSEWPIVGTSQLPTWGLWLLGIYGAGVLVLYIRFWIQLATLLHMGMTSKTMLVNGRMIHVLPENKSPFSFFNWIFMDPAEHEEQELESILLHEEAHVSQKHSLDIIWAEMVSIFFWFNPFVWLLKREIRTNLEFLADNEVCSQAPSIKQYQYHLLGLACEGKHQMLTNRLNMAPLKRRIIMMNKQKSVGSRGWSYLLFVPVVVILGLVSHLDVMGRAITSSTGVKITLKKSAPTQVKQLKHVVVEANTSTTSTLPSNILLIVDGQEYKKDINLISPDDIESMDVIKGVMAVKKYGKKAKNGVLIITRKH